MLCPELRNKMVNWIKDHCPVNTKKTYKSYANHYLRWCASEGQDPLKAESMCDCIRHGLEERGLGRSTLADVLPAAVEDYFRFEDTSPARDCASMITGMKKVVRSLTRPPVPRKPVHRTQLEKMAAVAKANLKETRDILMLVMMFAGFLRESEAVALQAKDVWVTLAKNKVDMVLYMVIRKSKTDQNGENATVVVSGCPTSPICPVMWYYRYMALRRESPFLFHQVPKNSVAELAKGTPYRLIKAWLARIKVDPKGYGSHSLRRGGATAAARAHVRMHVLKKHGRWKSDAVYMYIVDGPEEQLGVSQAVLAGP